MAVVKAVKVNGTGSVCSEALVSAPVHDQPAVGVQVVEGRNVTIKHADIVYSGQRSIVAVAHGRTRASGSRSAKKMTGQSPKGIPRFKKRKFNVSVAKAAGSRNAYVSVHQEKIMAVGKNQGAMVELIR